MSKKYDMRICKCGRIHMVDNNKLDNALENNKNLLLICGGCGAATLIGADIEPDWNEPDKNCYMMYSGELSPYDDRNIISADFESTEHHKGIEEIIYSHGRKVPMMTGMYATDYNNGRFSDRWYPDFYKIQRSDMCIAVISCSERHSHGDGIAVSRYARSSHLYKGHNRDGNVFLRFSCASRCFFGILTTPW